MFNVRLGRATLGVVTLLFTILPSSEAAIDTSKPSQWFEYDFSMSRRPEPNFSYVSPQNEDPTYTHLTLPACELGIKSDCIQSIESKSENGEVSKLKLLRYLPVGYSGECVSIKGGPGLPGCGRYTPNDEFIVTKADPKRDIPVGSKSSIWEFNDGKKSQLFLLSLNVSGWVNGTQKRAMNSGIPIGEWNDKVNWVDFSLNLTPISIDSGPSDLPKIFGGQGTYALDDAYCYPTSSSIPLCLHKSYVADIMNIKLTFASTYTSSIFSELNWMTSRSANARFLNTPVSNSEIRSILEFSGDFTTIYDAGFQFDKTEEDFQHYCESIFPNPCKEATSQEAMRRQFMGGSSSGIQGDAPQALEKWNVLSDHFEAIEERHSTVWNFHTASLDFRSKEKIQFCTKAIVAKGISNVVSGLTYSDATVFSQIPPTWNEEEQTLEFKVASLHANTKGEVISGFYGLALEKNIAECIWGLNVTNARAQLNVIGESGNQQVITSTYGIQNNYLIFQVAGFHYSTNTVKVKMLAAAAPISTPSPSPSSSLNVAKPSVAQIKAIVCKRGNATKTIRALVPKCPAGYKKITWR